MPNVSCSWWKVKRYNGFFLNVQIYDLLDDVGSADEDDIDNLMNDSDTKFIAEEKIIKAASTQETSLTTPEANLHVVPSDN